MKILETADQLPVLHVLAARQTIFYFVFIRGFCRGLFDFILTCLYQNNISVDAEWHITCLVDLEWTCTKPNKIFRSSFWLIDKGVDQSILMEYNSIWYKSIEDLTIEERKLESVALVNLETSRPRLSNIIFNLGKTEHFGTLQGSQAVLICLWYLQVILNHYSAKTLMKKNLSGCFQFFPKRTSGILQVANTCWSRSLWWRSRASFQWRLDWDNLVKIFIYELDCALYTFACCLDMATAA